MKRPVLMLVSLVLAGCATSADLLPRPDRVVVSGTSMLPALEPGTCLAVRRVPFGALKAGDIVCYRSPFCRTANQLVAHRLQRLTPQGWVAKGDNNAHRDMLPVTPANYVGLVVPLGEAATAPTLVQADTR